jgi:hypothetical protein
MFSVGWATARASAGRQTSAARWLTLGVSGVARRRRTGRTVSVPCSPSMRSSGTTQEGITMKMRPRPENPFPTIQRNRLRVAPRTRLALFVGFLLVALLACSGNSGYGESFRNSFLTSCETNSSAAKCECMLQWFQNNVSASKASDDAQELQQGGTPSDVYDAVLACS